MKYVWQKMKVMKGEKKMNNVYVDTMDPLKPVEGYPEFEPGKKVSLCPPWIEYFNKLECMFAEDPDVHLSKDGVARTFKMRVEDPVKAEALSELLPHELAFGGVEWKLQIIPGNLKHDRVSLLTAALKGNPHFQEVELPQGDGDRPFTYFVFDKDVAQYYNDDLGDAYGYRSLLYADLAKELFGADQGIRFCTDVFGRRVKVEDE